MIEEPNLKTNIILRIYQIFYFKKELKSIEITNNSFIIPINNISNTYLFKNIKEISEGKNPTAVNITMKKNKDNKEEKIWIEFEDAFKTYLFRSIVYHSLVRLRDY